MFWDILTSKDRKGAVMFIPILLFMLGLVFLVKGGDMFVGGATGVARRFRIPELLIGATVVSIGTTLPEVIFSATSALEGHGSLAYGNAIGSIICNTALVAALTILFRPSMVDRSSLILPTIFFFSASLIYTVSALVSGRMTRIIGVVFLTLFVLYVASLIWGARGSKVASEQSPAGGKAGRFILFIIIGGALIAIGSRLLVDGGTLIAEALGVPEAVISLTFVAIGTSLPELSTAITSIVKGHGSLALGNVIGANVLNLTLVCGVSATLSPFTIPTSAIVDIPVMRSVMAILTLPPLIRGRLSRYQGILLILIYSAFCLWRFIA